MSKLYRIFSAVLLLSIPNLCSAEAKRATADSPSPFGVCNPWEGVKEAGIKWVRCGAGSTALDWNGIQPAPDKMAWAQADAEVADAESKGLSLLPIIGYTARWAARFPGTPNDPPSDLATWRNWVGQLVGRYKGRVSCWEIWNEPNIDFFRGSPAEYVRLLKCAYIAAKRADPSCRICLGGTAGVDLRFMELLYELGAQRYWDIVAVHPYQWGPKFNAELMNQQLTALRALMLMHDDRSPIWLTEMGWSTGDKEVTEAIQARLLVQSIVTALFLGNIGVEKVFWYNAKDWGGAGHGLFREDGSKKPSYDAYRALATKLSGASWAAKMLLGPNASGHVFRKGRRWIVVAWSEDGGASAPLPCEGNVIVTDMLGAEKTVKPPLGTANIPLSANPVYIEGKLKLPALPVQPARAQSRRAEYLLPVWLDAHWPEGTNRPFLRRGQRNFLTVEAHNDSDRAVSGEVQLSIQKLGVKQKKHFSAAGGRSASVIFEVTPKADAEIGLYETRLDGAASGRPLAPLELKMRLSDAGCIEFLANSHVERRYYLHEDRSSGRSTSVRFGGSWSYRFELPKAKRATVSMLVGAHMRKHWLVSASRDGKEWTTLVEGSSARSWQSAALDGFLPGTVYLRFDGDDQQLEELVLEVTEGEVTFPGAAGEASP